MSKIVYVLGAGFSKCTNAPLQKDILKEIFDLKPFYPDDFDKPFVDSRKRLEDFLIELFNEDDINELVKIDLENLFTIMDKAIINREFINDKSFEDISKLRSDLNCCIVYMFNEKLRGSITGFYSKLAEQIVKRRTSGKQKDDPFGFITLNWDIILENTVFQETKVFNENKGDDEAKCFVDYTCYAYPFNMSDYPHRSIDVKPKGHYNIKIMKLHGSLNWLVCSNCGRLFFKLDEKIAIYELLKQKKCPECEQKALRSLIVTPTLLKDLNNTHLKMVWHNALLDLMEAEKVVFVGYSFPIADFELRYLLKRGISKKAKIEVVLRSDNKEVFERFQQFFGKQFKPSGRITSGTAGYFASEFGLNLMPFDCPDDNVRITAELNKS